MTSSFVPVPVPAPVLPVPTPLPLPEPRTTAGSALTPLVKEIFTTSVLSFHLNGTPITLHNADPHSTLLDFIRSQRSLKGTKLGCGEGGCGACTVVVQHLHPTNARISHLAVNACLAPLVSVEGKHVLTVEALGSAENPHPLQERIARYNGSQCGFCTPGIVMSLYALLRNAYDPLTEKYRLAAEEVELKGALDGNLCRCTGYKTILEAARTFVAEDLGGVVEDVVAVEGAEDIGALAEEVSGARLSSCGRLGGCCRDSPERGSCSETSGGESESTAATTPLEEFPEKEKGGFEFPQLDFQPYRPGTELIFPSALRRHELKPLFFGNERKVWFRPVTLEQLLRIKEAFSSSKIVAGASEVQVEIKLKNEEYAVAVYVGDISELKGFQVDEDRGEVVIGGNTTLSTVETECTIWCRKLGVRAVGLEAVKKQLRYFAGRQVGDSYSCYIGEKVMF
jgi:xanthine dehydrogenase/oxidase